MDTAIVDTTIVDTATLDTTIVDTTIMDMDNCLTGSVGLCLTCDIQLRYTDLSTD